MTDACSRTPFLYIRLEFIKAKMGAGKQSAVAIESTGATGVVILCEDTATVLGEYWQLVRTDEGEQHHPGSDLDAMGKARGQNA